MTTSIQYLCIHTKTLKLFQSCTAHREAALQHPQKLIHGSFALTELKIMVPQSQKESVFKIFTARN